MKRLVICCDGTWNKPDNKNVTNIEKIARTIQIDPAACGGVEQLVLYVGGVGIGYKLDRLLGGAFGSGLFNNVKTAYRFLALNYEPGDEIFVFGFSRGAYTARSLAGMVGHVGLLTRKSLVDSQLPEAVSRYQRKRPEGPDASLDDAQFKMKYCHADLPITFIGVFDTVGALGVPGILPKDHEFHDIDLGDAVMCARQALAIDEGRMTFAPCLWVAPAPDNPERVKQVWFEGAHSDVGGGYGQTGLSDTALLWMVTEAIGQGLVFDGPLLDEYVKSGSPRVRHSSLTVVYRLLNARERVRARLGSRKDTFMGWKRNLDAQGSGVRVAASAIDHFDSTEQDYQPPNLRSFLSRRNESEKAALREAVITLPE